MKRVYEVRDLSDAIDAMGELMGYYEGTIMGDWLIEPTLEQREELAQEFEEQRSTALDVLESIKAQIEEAKVYERLV